MRFGWYRDKVGFILSERLTFLLQQIVTARLCRSLRETVDHIGLNVQADNDAALACYRKLGFEIVAPYGEFTVEQK